MPLINSAFINSGSSLHVRVEVLVVDHLFAHDRIEPLLGDLEPTQGFREGVLGGYRKEVRWRTLQNGDVGTPRRHGGHYRSHGRPGADHQNFFVSIVQVFWPGLWMDNRPPKIVHSRHCGV